MNVHRPQLRLLSQQNTIVELERNVNLLGTTVGDLRAELRKFRHLESSQSIASGSSISVPESPFLKKLPAEVRVNIYKYLLFNPQLGQVWWIGSNTKYGATFKYELSPSILRVCHKLYDEAFPVLYDLNTFIFVCHRRDPNNLDRISNVPQCPLTRYIDTASYGSYSTSEYFSTHRKVFDFNEAPNLNAITRWRVITASTYQQADLPSKSLVGLCRILCFTTLRHLAVTIVLSKKGPNGLAYTRDSAQNEGGHAQLAMIGNALQVLSNVSDVEISVAQKHELPTGFSSSDLHWYPLDTGFGLAMRSQQVTLLRAAPSIEKVFIMNRLLLTYARAFERDESIKAEMDADYFRSLNADYEKNPLSSDNPFHIPGETNTAEFKLERATLYSDCQDVEAFKNCRKEVLQQFEEQYGRILTAMKDLHRHVREQKSPSGLFDPELFESEEWEIVCERTMEVLENAAKAFERDTTSYMKLQMRKFSGRYRLNCNHLPRERWISRIDTLFKCDATIETMDVDHFIELFKLVADDMQKQFIEIRNARKELLSADISTDPKMYLYMATYEDKPFIDWSVDDAMFEI